MCRLKNIPICDYQESVTTGQTDRRQTKWSLCAAMLRRWHNKWTAELDLLLNYENFPLNISNGCGMPTLHKGILLLRSLDPHIWDLHAIYLLKVNPILFPQAWPHQTMSLELPKRLSRLYLQNLRSSTFCHQIHVQVLLNLVKEDNTVSGTCTSTW